MSRVLIVDDHPTMRSAIRAVLEQEGYEVEESGDGEAALTRIAERPPDAVILDLSLPDIPGLDVLARLRADPATSSVRVIVVSAFGEDGRAGAIAAGADAYLTKPFGPSALLPTVRRVLEEAAPPAG